MLVLKHIQGMRKLVIPCIMKNVKLIMYDELGDSENFTNHSVRLQRVRTEYNKFAKKANLHSQMYRARVSGYKRSTKSISGAITDINSRRARIHAEIYYEEIRKQSTDVERISKNTGYDIETIREIKNYLFLDEHELEDGRKRFDPDFAIAQSWQRLAQNDIQSHDLTLIKHEVLEKDLMNKGLPQDEAHKVASKKYNYQDEGVL